MTEQERELVIEYIKLDESEYIAYISLKGRDRGVGEERVYNTTGFKFYAINHAWKALVSELKKEAYRRWINLIIKIRRWIKKT